MSKSTLRKQRLLEAALILFSTTGYEKTMVTDITREADIAKATFYYYFPTKESILFAIFDEYAKKIAFEIETQTAGKDALMKLQVFMQKFFTAHDMDKLVHNLQADNRQEMVTKIWRATQKLLEPILKDIIKQGYEEKKMKNAYRDYMLRFFWDIFSGLLYAAHIGEAPEQLQERKDVALKLFAVLFGIEENALQLEIPQIINK